MSRLPNWTPFSRRNDDGSGRLAGDMKSLGSLPASLAAFVLAVPLAAAAFFSAAAMSKPTSAQSLLKSEAETGFPPPFAPLSQTCGFSSLVAGSGSSKKAFPLAYPTQLDDSEAGEVVADWLLKIPSPAKPALSAKITAGRVFARLSRDDEGTMPGVWRLVPVALEAGGHRLEVMTPTLDFQPSSSPSSREKQICQAIKLQAQRRLSQGIRALCLSSDLARRA